MADENLAPDGVEGEEIRPDDAQPIIEQQEEAVTPESLASELGWSPKDQWRGDEADWKPATDFLKDTVQINKAERRARKNLEDRISRISRTTDAMIERVRAEERAKVEAEFSAAVDEGDHERARKASVQLAQIDSAPTTEAAPVQDFATRNASWWKIDPLATQMAANISNMLAEQGKTAEEQCKAAEEAVKKRFPEYFETDKPRSKGPAEVAEQQGRTARTNTGTRTRGYADLPADAKAAALKFEKHGVTKEAFASEYWKENA